MNTQISHGEKKQHKNINTMFLSLRSKMVVISIEKLNQIYIYTYKSRHTHTHTQS